MAGGYIINEATSEKTAVQWVNGVPQDFSVGCQGNSRVSQIMNWNDMFLFQCVMSENGVQLCHNGALYKEIKEEFIPSCWDIVVEQVQVK